MVQWIQIPIFNVKWLERAEKKTKIISCELNLFDTRIQSWNFFLRLMSCKNDEYCLISHHWFDTMELNTYIQCSMDRKSRKNKTQIAFELNIFDTRIQSRNLSFSVISWEKTNLVRCGLIDLIPWIKIPIINVKKLRKSMYKNKIHIMWIKLHSTLVFSVETYFYE